MSASPYATIVRTDPFDLAKANAFVRLYLDDSDNLVHEVQGHNNLGFPLHIMKNFGLGKEPEVGRSTPSALDQKRHFRWG